MKFQKMSYTQGILVSHKLLKLTIIQPHKAKKSLSRRANSLLKQKKLTFLTYFNVYRVPPPSTIYKNSKNIERTLF